MAHDKAYVVCENKCLVEAYGKEQVDDRFSTIEELYTNTITETEFRAIVKDEVDQGIDAYVASMEVQILALAERVSVLEGKIGNYPVQLTASPSALYFDQTDLDTSQEWNHYKSVTITQVPASVTFDCGWSLVSESTTSDANVIVRWRGNVIDFKYQGAGEHLGKKTYKVYANAKPEVYVLIEVNIE